MAEGKASSRQIVIDETTVGKASSRRIDMVSILFKVIVCFRCNLEPEVIIDWNSEALSTIQDIE